MDGWIRYYPPDVFPALWTNLETMIAQRCIISPDEVLHELEKKDDGLHAWAKGNDIMFHPLDGPVQHAASEILARFPRLVDSNSGRSRGDPWVIALAMVRGCAILTGEKPSGNPVKPKIPDVCKHYGIRCLNMLEFIREQKWRFSFR